MSTVKSWAIINHGSRASKPTATQPSHAASPSNTAGVAAVQPLQVPEDVRSTGFFDTPLDEGIPTNLTIFLSSFDTETRGVTVRVNRSVGGRIEEIFSRSLDIPSGEGRRLDVDDVAGQTLEIRVDSGDEIIPSAVVAHYFVADGGIVVQVYRSPNDFVRL